MDPSVSARSAAGARAAAALRALTAGVSPQMEGADSLRVVVLAQLAGRDALQGPINRAGGSAKVRRAALPAPAPLRGQTGQAGAWGGRRTHRMVPADGLVDARKADPAVAACVVGLRAATADFMLAWAPSARTHGRVRPLARSSRASAPRLQRRRLRAACKHAVRHTRVPVGGDTRTRTPPYRCAGPMRAPHRLPPATHRRRARTGPTGCLPGLQS